jgi:hypothetical protein
LVSLVAALGCRRRWPTPSTPLRWSPLC